MRRLRRASNKAVLVLLMALAFVAGGVSLPRIVDATVSSGERASFFPLPPARILDTRFGPSPQPVGTKLAAAQTMELQVGGRGGVPASAGAAVLNVTVTGASSWSHLTVFPVGTVKPTASSLNFGAGDTIPNAVTVKLGTGGKVAIFNNSGSVDVIADVNGYYENVNFDDRYYTKAQSDTKVATAITTPNHVTGAAVQDGSLTGADIQDGTLRLSDLTGRDTFSNVNIGPLSVPANGCTVTSVTVFSSFGFELFVPMRVAPGIPGSTGLSAAPVVLNGSGSAALQICSRTTAFATGAATVDYYLA